jgi:Ca2+-binding RTX toxin-like protein
VILKRDDYLRFIPSTSVAGEATVTYRIWDRINRSTGSVVDLSSPGSVGGSTDFSAETATSSAAFSQAPVANAGGPYIVYEGQSLFLDASASSDPEGGPLTYSWDVNGDGTYGDAIGSTPTLTWAQLDALGIRSGPLNRNVRARVTDDIGLTTTSPTVTLEIRNSPPVAQILGPNFLVRGQTRDFTFAATDPSTTDQAATFHYLVDWEGDGYIDADLTGSGWGVAASHAYTVSGVYAMRMVALDRDGGISAMVEQVITVVDWALLTDLNDSTKTDLHWGGTTGIDAYGFLPGIVITQAQNNLFFGTPSVTLLPAYNGKTYVYGQAGGDLLFADVMANPLVVDGGDGNDVLVGGRAGDTLLGGAGADILLGGTLEADGGDWLDGGEGDDLLIGHLGADTLRGSAGSDLLLAGGLNFGASLPNAVYSIQAEWTSGRSLAARVENLTGTGSGPRNNGDFFLQPSVTLLDDTAIDDVMDQSSESWLLVDFDEDLVTHLPADLLTDIG